MILRNVSRSFDGKPVLRHVSLLFPAGEICCVRGRSGIGKTTLLRIIAGLLSPDEGTVEGVPDKIAFVFQEDRLCEDFSALSNIRMVTKNRTKEEILQHLEELELRGEASLAVREFSGGMRRRVALARAICADADLLLLDEPFKGLDPELRIRVIDYVKRHTEGKTVICVTHEETEAVLLGGRMIELEDSK
ncbi:MAG: ATP-binding cassette domain-containing protein [Oscillospiraceae bacterium]|nr:ATP-binding cassette domain-containing protein [Oscillospiraceae bacterium]